MRKLVVPLGLLIALMAVVAPSADAFSPGGIGITAANGWFRLVFLNGVTETALNLHGFMLHFGLILVLALMAAIPRMSLVRLAAWLVGAAGLFLVIHIAGLSLLVWALWWAFRDNTSIMDTGQVFAAFAIFWALVPAITGACHNWRGLVLPVLAPRTAARRLHSG